MTRTCRRCGCTDDRACVDRRGACWWVGAELCSHCAQPDMMPLRLFWAHVFKPFWMAWAYFITLEPYRDNYCGTWAYAQTLWQIAMDDLDIKLIWPADALLIDQEHWGD